MHGVSGTLGNNTSLNPASGKREVTNQIEYLVTNELIGKTQWPILHGFAGKNNGGRVRNTANQAHIAQLGLIFLPSKGACRSDQVGVGARLDVAQKAFPANGRGEIDQIVDLVSRAGIDADELVALAHF